MPSNRWIGVQAGKARRLAARAAHRLEPLPRLPFAVALAAAAVVLAVSVEWQPRPYDDIAEVSELPTAAQDWFDFTSGPQVEFQITEYGFSTVVDELGFERVILGAVVRNPFDTAIISPGSIDIVAMRDGAPATALESFYPNPIPADTSVTVGHVLSSTQLDLDPADLRLETREPSFLSPDPAELGPDELDYGVVDPLPEITVLSVEPLLSPEGYRLHYRVVSDATREIRLAVLFRDAAGALIGGLPAAEDPFSFELGSAGWRTVMEGETVQELDLHASWIPEGADLGRTEIGPRSLGGG
ncbi:hypothetical protein SAMN05216298_1284 [Glycomyces sambucus]|uniref:Uncharacterized protein n=1 Tax=Glycomyces sambucus TaxID=380244 RepID=A0A1G9E424_9ACTN|nr:hypothetical protein [Glycomyces sambucus]SDK70881.1 hypothetical protein SAMN05216298_1284 [Glycomyces sambucus]